MDDSGTYLGNIYGIFEECIRNIHRYSWFKIIRNPDPMGRPPKAAPLCSLLLLIFCLRYEYLLIFLIYSLCISYLQVLNIFLVFPFACFVIYSVNSRSGHDRSQTFGSISHVSNPKLTFWGNFIILLHGFAWRNPKNIVFLAKKNTERMWKYLKK